VNHWGNVLKEKLDTRTARVCIVGMGYVGLSLAVELAKAGLTVRGVDLDLERVSLLNRGESYLVDVAADTLAPLVAAGTLSATTSFEDAGAADAIVICVPTPLRKTKDPDLSFIPPDLGIDITKWNTIVTKYVPLKGADGKGLKDGMGNELARILITDMDGVFAGGDAEIGPLTVVACVGNAHRAARVIQRWLEEGKAYITDDELMEDILTNLPVYDKNEQVPWLDSAHREHQAEVHGPERASCGNYQEVELGFANSQAVREAERCLRCYRVAMVAV